jgi:hypothetical protein
VPVLHVPALSIAQSLRAIEAFVEAEIHVARLEPENGRLPKALEYTRRARSRHRLDDLAGEGPGDPGVRGEGLLRPPHPQEARTRCGEDQRPRRTPRAGRDTSRGRHPGDSRRALHHSSRSALRGGEPVPVRRRLLHPRPRLQSAGLRRRAQRDRRSGSPLDPRRDRLRQPGHAAQHRRHQCHSHRRCISHGGAVVDVVGAGADVVSPASWTRPSSPCCGVR